MTAGCWHRIASRRVASHCYYRWEKRLHVGTTVILTNCRRISQSPRACTPPASHRIAPCVVYSSLHPRDAFQSLHREPVCPFAPQLRSYRIFLWICSGGLSLGPSRVRTRLIQGRARLGAVRTLSRFPCFLIIN